jgi:hypothetical protein
MTDRKPDEIDRASHPLCLGLLAKLPRPSCPFWRYIAATDSAYLCTMRRLTPRYKHWLLRRTRYEARKRRRPSPWQTALIQTRAGVKLARVLADDTLPPILCLDKAYEQTVGFIQDLRIRTSRLPSRLVRTQIDAHRGRVGWIRNYQDFKTLREISPGAALLLAAEYDRARTLGGFPLATVDLKGWDDQVYATLSMLGFFDLLDIPQELPKNFIDAFHIEPLASEMAANSQPALDRIVALFERAGGDAGLRLALCGAVVDALENVRDHAYPQDQFVDIRHIPNWWFTGAAHRDQRWLILSIYDQGITIPMSLPRRFGLEHVLSVFQTWFRLPFDPKDPKHDGAAIDAAMRLSATRTPEHYRGKGLAKIREVVRHCRGGQLRIVSRNGEYIFDGSRTQTKTHAVTLPGTYVEIVATF